MSTDHRSAEQFRLPISIHVVLMRPIYPRNVGMCARAAANLGCQRLILVDSEVSIDEHEAKQGAAGAQQMLTNATVYRSLNDFYATEGDGVRIAFSGATGRLRVVEDFEALLTRWERPNSAPESNEKNLLDSTGQVYLIFGTEDKGLSDEEMQLCHHICALPAHGEFTSLNLSHAVLLACHLTQTFVRRRSDASIRFRQSSSEANLTSSQPISSLVIPHSLRPSYFPDRTIDRWLQMLGFDLNAPKVNIAKTLKRILISQEPSTDDLRILDSVLQQTIRRLEEKK